MAPPGTGMLILLKTYLTARHTWSFQPGRSNINRVFSTSDRSWPVVPTEETTETESKEKLPEEPGPAGYVLMCFPEKNQGVPV